MSESVPALVDHLFRHTAGRVIATLVRRFGPRHLELAEDVTQEALVKALRLWPYRGVPDSPEAWLRRVAFNQMIDAFRREGRVGGAPGDLDAVAPGSSPDDDGDLLAMMLMCCRPEIPRDAQVALTLKVVAGFDVREIARAFLAKEATIAQRLSRARRTIRERAATFERIEADELDERIEAVAATLYLMFNEGYAMSSGDAHISWELCHEAIRLTRLLTVRTGDDHPGIDALLAMMLLQAARLPGRLSETGDILTLEEQDRRTWDRRMIDQGVEALNRSARGDELTVYHLLAGIASFHSLAVDYASTDWRSILEHYDALIERSCSPLVELNRCVALAMVHGPHAGLCALDRLLEAHVLEDYALLHATAGELAGRSGDMRRAFDSYDRAKELVATEPERRLLERKLGEHSGAGPSS